MYYGFRNFIVGMFFLLLAVLFIAYVIAFIAEHV